MSHLNRAILGSSSDLLIPEPIVMILAYPAGPVFGSITA